jgi:glycosyltransferase involved in cell wall biosynthesis
MILLSILIPSIPSREEKLIKLRTELHYQNEALKIQELGEVEFLVDDSKRFLDGGLSIGKKREALVQRARGKYLCFLDDDETIAPNYLEVLLNLCNQDKDVCTFRNISKLDNYWMIVDMSLAYSNEEANPNHDVRRAPWHMCPVRSEYAKQFPFEDVNYAEDWTWMKKVLELCQNEAKSNAIIHQYNYSSFHSESDKITRHEKLFTNHGATDNP